MKIIIDIPKEFEVDFNTDKFKDFFSRVAADIDCNGLCGNYEKETAEMFRNAFENGEVVSDNNWISVKDKLPEINEEVIVTTSSGRVWCIYYGYTYKSDKEPCFHEWDNEMWQCFKPNVIAWMRMPKAYSEGGNSNE